MTVAFAMMLGWSFVAVQARESLAIESEQAHANRWAVLDQFSGQGEQCLVCDKQVFGKDVVEIRYRGRVFHVVAGEMFEIFGQDPERYFRKLQARSALFDESAVAPTQKQMSVAWLGIGLYVLLGLIIGAACSYLAVAKGLPPAPWFFAGLVGNGAVLAALLNAKSRHDNAAPAGIPPGLKKVPTTHTPVICYACGTENHPSAVLCGCGVKLEPTARSEVPLV